MCVYFALSLDDIQRIEYPSQALWWPPEFSTCWRQCWCRQVRDVLQQGGRKREAGLGTWPTISLVIWPTRPHLYSHSPPIALSPIDMYVQIYLCYTTYCHNLHVLYCMIYIWKLHPYTSGTWLDDVAAEKKTPKNLCSDYFDGFLFLLIPVKNARDLLKMYFNWNQVILFQPMVK